MTPREPRDLAAASVETYVAQTLVRPVAQGDPADRHDPPCVVDLEVDSAVANARPQRAWSSQDRGDASPAWLDAEVMERD